MHPTQVAARSLQRDRLIQELTQGADARVVLVTGPAGSGKSTLLADFVGRRTRRVAWLGLGEEDQDPHIFFSYFFESLCQTYRGCCETTRNRLATFDLSAPQALCMHFINELFAYNEPVAIVLDDYHLVDGQAAIGEFFQLLCRRGPTNLQLFLVSRDLPQLPVAWLRSKRLLTELHHDHLRFTAAEADQLFREIWGISLSADLLDRLMEKTEGWATGLQLVAQSLRSKSPEEMRIFLQGLGGREESIYNYLASEVLENQPPRVRQFLQETSLPEYFNPPLAQELVPQVDVAEMLEYLHQARLFLIPLEREGQWYRYHHLFRDFLRSTLSQEHGLEHVQAVHQRIAHWLHHHDELVASIPHYLASGDPNLACNILEEVGSELLHRGLRTSLARWLDGLPLTVRSGRPGLGVVQAELQEMQGQWTKAVEGYRKSLAEYRRLEDHPKVAWVLQKLSLCYIKYGESKQLLETCREGLALCPPDQISLRSMLQCWMGSTLVNAGQDWAQGYDLIRSGHAAAFESGDPGAISWAALTYGFGFHFPQGNFTEALRTLNEGIDFFSRLGWPMVLYQLVMNKAVVLTLMGQFRESKDLVDETLIQAKRAGHTYVEKGLEVLRGMSYLESRELEPCRDALSRTSQSEIPAQFKPYFFRTRMLLNTLLQNFDQAQVDAEEMERSLLLNGAGVYALECNVSLAFLCSLQGKWGQAVQTLQDNLELCGAARSKFWEMKTLQVLAWCQWQQRQNSSAMESLSRTLKLACSNGYDDYWLCDSWSLAAPLLVLAACEQIEVAYVERLLLLLNDRLGPTLEDMIQDPDPAVRRVTARFLGRHPSDGNKAKLKQLARSDADDEVRELARQALQVGSEGGVVEFRCLGNLRIVRDDEAVDYGRLLRPMAIKLLKFFLVHGSKLIANDRILDLFWPEVDPEKARHTLATHLSALRRSLSIANLFQRVGESYRLCISEELRLDALEFEEAVHQALALARGGDHERAIHQLERAEALYRGPFLEEELYEDWVELRRRELHLLHEQVLEKLGDLYLQQHQYGQAIQRYRRLLLGEEPREQVFPKMFRCFEALGDRQGRVRNTSYCVAGCVSPWVWSPSPAFRLWSTPSLRTEATRIPGSTRRLGWKAISTFHSPSLRVRAWRAASVSLTAPGAWTGSWRRSTSTGTSSVCP